MEKSKLIENIFSNIPNPEKYALISEYHEKISYKDLLEMTKNICMCMRENTVALLVMNNDLGSVIFYLASLMVGVVPIIVDKTVTKQEMKQYISKYTPEYLFVLTHSETDKEMRKQRKYNIVQMIFRHCMYTLEENVELKQISRSLAILLPTSGTTHVSKLVRISHENMFNNTVNICNALQIRQEDLAITSLPLSYTYGLSVLNTHLMRHATVLLTDRSIIQKSFWDFANKYRATSFSGVPYTYELLEKSAHRRKENTIQVYTQAGGKLPIRLQTIYADYCRDNNKKFYIMYGQTEATARISVLQPEYINDKVGSVGRVINGGFIRVSKEYRLQNEGEIVYFGKNVCMGYCTCMGDLAKEDENRGVLFTGDIGYVDEDGFLFITGRKSGFIKKFGRRISLSSIERMLEEQYNMETIVKVSESVLVVVLEKKDSLIVNRLKSELPKQLHLKEKDISFQIIEQFERTYNGKLQVRSK